jgi:hypothetical protein
MTTPLSLHQVAETVADRGVGAVDTTLIDGIAATGLANGASPTLVEVLVDPDEPAVARIRAFGLVALVAARSDRFALAA